MKFIKIFLASSVVEFENERKDLGDYIRTLNDCYIKQGIYFELTICEDLSNAIAAERKQEEYNKKIRESQYFYVLFGKDVGAYTVEEFEVALKQFRETGAPHIYTYFYQLAEEESISKTVTDFRERLDREIGHYYSLFSHLDSVKLNILLELTRNKEVVADLKLEEGQAVLNGEPVLTLENIPVYSKNETLQNCIAEKHRLDEEFVRLRMDMAGHPEDDQLFHRLMKVSEQREQISSQIRDLEIAVLQLCSTISEQNSSGRMLTWREKKASQLLDVGDFEGALTILNDAERKKELETAKSIVENGIDQIQSYISEERLKIKILKSQGINKETIPEIMTSYEECVQLAEKYHLGWEVLFEYSDFLKKQRKYSEALITAQRLNDWCKVMDIPENVQATIKRHLGDLFYVTYNRLEDAETFYLESLEIVVRLSEKYPYDNNLSIMADEINSLASLYMKMNRFKEAETFYQQALEIHRLLSEVNLSPYKWRMAKTYNNLAMLYANTNREKEAEGYYHEALKIFRKFSAEDPVADEYKVATTCNNLATLYRHMNRFKEAENYYQEAFKTIRRLSQENPSAYDVDYADICNNLGVLYAVTNRQKKAENYFLKALDIHRLISQEYPSIYKQKLARTCNNLEILYTDANRIKEAEKYHQEVLRLDKQKTE
jgi:tetratricopeptide (TPR) repeat protein